MSENLHLCIFTEGRITLPDRYQDRTVNVFTLPGENKPAFNISRDSMNEDETLSGYIDRQLGRDADLVVVVNGQIPADDPVVNFF